MWEEVDYDNPIVYTGYTIGKIHKDGLPWYTMDMTEDSVYDGNGHGGKQEDYCTNALQR